MQPVLWKDLSAPQRTAALRRPALQARPQVAAAVRTIIAAVRREGDSALRRLTKKFDGVPLRALRVSPAELAAADASLGRADKSALRAAYLNIHTFHAAQRPADLRLETQAGIICEKTSRPIGRVGLYVPGGSAPLPSTALMLGVPSQLAGCAVRVLCTPPDRAGGVNPWILAAARLCGITESTRSRRAGHRRPGLRHRQRAEVRQALRPGQRVCHRGQAPGSRDPAGAALDLPAGPSELLVIADDRANPAFVAADLLSQAEHGPDSQVILVAFSQSFARRVLVQLRHQLAGLPRAATARRALAHSRIFLTASRAEAVALANRYAPEHLLLQVARPRDWLAGISTAGSVFLGDLTPESLGDYASGTNHVLPTYGWARVCSGLGLADFQRTMTVQTATRAGLQKLGPIVERLALAEGLAAHQRAVRVRLESFPAGRAGRARRAAPTAGLPKGIVPSIR